MGTTAQIDRDLHEILTNPGDPAAFERLSSSGMELLSPLAHYLSRDLSIEVLERFEDLLKVVLRGALSGEVSGETARELARFQREVGLLLKYKSYAVKAASPLGYSIFLQSPREGFSFQRHVTHKVEVFHILEASPGGFVFLCGWDDWREHYEPERFAAWLAGAPDTAYDRFRYPAAPGDVHVISELGTVHTVIGCVLEEFATVSTDMVERLHDQNRGRPVPPHFDRAFVEERLRELRTPAESRLVTGIAAAPRVTPLEPRPVAGGRRTVLADSFVTASLWTVDRGAETEPLATDGCAASLYVRAGCGRVLLGTQEELARPTPPSIEVAANDLLTLPPGASYAFVAEGDAPLELVEHEIRPDVALL